MGTRHAKPYILRGGSSTKLGQRDTPCALLNVVFPFVLSQVIQDSEIKHTPQELFDPHRSLIVSISAQSVAPSVGPATNSPFQTKSITTKPRDLLFWHDKQERDDTTLSPAFVEANYEVFKSLLRERRRQMRNEDLRTELEYFSEEYDEEREMKPRPTRDQEATPVLQVASSRIQRHRERVVEFEDALNREGSRVKRNTKGGRPLEQRVEENGPQGMNLPPLLAAHLGRRENGQPLPSSLTSVQGGRHPSTNTRGNLPPNCMLLS
ncbi:hypothetical protein Tco_1570375 [Tanacetum coccineum]